MHAIRKQGKGRCVSYLLLFTLLFASSALAQQAEDGLAAYYKFDGNMADATLKFDLSQKVAPAFIPGMAGQAAKFTGTSFAETKSSLNLDKAFTIAFWAMPTASGGMRTILAVPHPNALSIDTKALQTDLDGTAYTTPYAFPINEWTHVAITFDGAKLATYITSEKGQQTANVQTIPAAKTAAFIAATKDKNKNLIVAARCATLTSCTAKTSFYKGGLDDLRIYDKALTADEINKIVSFPKTAQQSELASLLEQATARNDDALKNSGKAISCLPPQTAIEQAVANTNYQVQLKQGWNFVSFPLKSPMQATALFPPSCVSWVWAYSEGNFVEAAQIEAGKGYWVKAKAQCQAMIPKTNLPASIKIQFVEGWNAVGGYTGDYAAISGVEGSAWAYTGKTFQTETGKSLTTGAWVKFASAQQDCSKQAAAEPGMLAYYPFEGSMADATTRFTPPAASSIPAFTHGIAGQAVQFSTKGSSYAEVANGLGLEKTGKFTIAFWAMPTVGGTVAAAPHPAALSVGIDASRRKIQTYLGGYSHAAPYSLPQNEWVHVAVTFDGTKLVTYITSEKGQQTVNQQAIAPRIASEFTAGTKGKSFIIGAQCASPTSCTAKTSFYKGSLDDLRIYDKALTANEIKAVAGLPKTVQKSELASLLEQANKLNEDEIKKAGTKDSCLPPQAVVEQAIPSADYKIPLKPGWNFVSFPLKSPTQTSALLPPSCVSVVWEYAGGDFVEAAQIEAGKGYWVKAKAQCRATIRKAAVAPNVKVQLAEGWNAVGGYTADYSAIGGVKGKPWGVSSGNGFQSATSQDVIDGVLVKFSSSMEGCNNAPVANPGYVQLGIDKDGDGSVEILLDGTGSSDADGKIEKYEWKEADKVLGISDKLSVNLGIGVHEITLTVTDDKGSATSAHNLIAIQDGQISSGSAARSDDASAGDVSCGISNNGGVYFYSCNDNRVSSEYSSASKLGDIYIHNDRVIWTAQAGGTTWALYSNNFKGDDYETISYTSSTFGVSGLDNIKDIKFFRDSVVWVDNAGDSRYWTLKSNSIYGGDYEILSFQTTSSSYITGIRFFGNYVVWLARFDNGRWGLQSNLLSGGSRNDISYDGNLNEFGSVYFHRDYIVWLQSVGSNWRLRSNLISGSQRNELSSAASSSLSFGSPAFHNDRVYWVDSTSGINVWKLYTNTLTGTDKYQLSKGSSGSKAGFSELTFKDDYVLWRDNTDTYWRLYSANGRNRAELSPRSGVNVDAFEGITFYKDRIIWKSDDMNSGKYNLFSNTLSGNNLVALGVPSRNYGEVPAKFNFHENRIYWVDSVGGYHHLRTNLITGGALTTVVGTELLDGLKDVQFILNPLTKQSGFVWQDNSDKGRWKVYTADIDGSNRKILSDRTETAFEDIGVHGSMVTFKGRTYDHDSQWRYAANTLANDGWFYLSAAVHDSKDLFNFKVEDCVASWQDCEEARCAVLTATLADPTQVKYNACGNNNVHAYNACGKELRLVERCASESESNTCSEKGVMMSNTALKNFCEIDHCVQGPVETTSTLLRECSGGTTCYQADCRLCEPRQTETENCESRGAKTRTCNSYGVWEQWPLHCT